MSEFPRVRTVFDFTEGTDPWPSIDDRVMGGVSSSEMVVADRRAVFRGTVSLDEGGGFASVRSEPRHHDLAGFDGIVLEVRGDGQRYKLRLRTTGTFDGVSYEAPLAPPAAEGGDREIGDWTTVRLPFSTFRPVFRGRPVPDAPPLDPARVQTFGFLISDEQEGRFHLEVRQIAAYRETD